MALPETATNPTWSQLRQTVRDVRAHFSTRGLRTPTGISFRKINDVTRLYFVSEPHFKRDTSLLYVDLPSPHPAPPWSPLLEAGFQCLPCSISKEEQLMWERKKVSSWGITSYDIHLPSGRIVFPAGGSLYYCMDYLTSTSPVFPYEIQSQTVGARLNATMCPDNPDLIAFVNNGDIWVTHLDSREEERLTFCHNSGAGGVAEDPVSAGLPSYVMQEEFCRFTGFWWRPANNSSRQERSYTLLYEELDEKCVEIVRILGYSTSPPAAANSPDSRPDVEEFRYPRADTSNARSSLKLIRFCLNTADEVIDREEYELGTPLWVQFPWAEYLVRAGWTPDGEYVWAQLLDRCQQRLELVIIPKTQFVLSAPDSPTATPIKAASTAAVNNSSSTGGGSARPPSTPASPAHNNPPPSSPPAASLPAVGRGSNGENRMVTSDNGGAEDLDPCQVITCEQSESWVSVHDILKFLPHHNRNQIKFLWASEESGHRHLYLVVAALYRGGRDTSPPDSSFQPRIVSRQQLTHGDWEVLNKQVWYDGKRELVYFQGLADTCLEPHLYVVSLRRPGEVRRLTSPGFSHSVEMGPDCNIMATVFSSVNSLPGCQVFAINQTDNTVEGVTLQSLGWLLQPSTPEKEFPPPELFSHTLISGHKLFGMLYKPHTLLPGTKYPVMLNVYGGPELQLVSNSFKGLRELRSHLLASQGYVVICIDNRGSLHRGVAWEAWLRGRLGQVELADQVEVLHWLASVTGYLDLARVAIHGWSYGGYLSLMGLIQYPQEFKLAVAGAPVTSWHLYDTGYTERYLDTPSTNPTAYKLGSIVNFVGQLPDEEGRLMIMHGTMDENVHFMQHTAQLINLLIKHGKPYQLQIYPGERHSLRHPDSNEHYLTTLLAFLKKNL